MKITIAVVLLFCVTFGSSRKALSDNHFWCTQEQRDVAKCGKNLDPVLGVSNTGTYKRFNNECEACKNWEVESYYRVTQCTTSLIAQDSDGSTSVGVCGVSLEGYLQDYRDEYFACDNNMESFFRGNCPRKLDTKVRYCPANPKPMFMCAMIYKPVCVTTNSGTQRTAGNGCSACGADDAVYYVDGACGGDGIFFPTPIVKPLPDIIEPVIQPVKPIRAVLNVEDQPISLSPEPAIIEPVIQPVQPVRAVLEIEDQPISLSPVQALLQKNKFKKH